MFIPQEIRFFHYINFINFTVTFNYSFSSLPGHVDISPASQHDDELQLCCVDEMRSLLWGRSAGSDLAHLILVFIKIMFYKSDVILYAKIFFLNLN